MENNSNKKLKGKMSIGLSLEMSYEEYQELFSKYQEYIRSLYFSPPLEGKYHSREEIQKQFSDPMNVKKFYKVLELAKDKGILLDCVLNRPLISQADVDQAIDYMKDMDIDQITCLQRHAKSIHSAFPEKELIYSYNNDLTPRDIPLIAPEFTTVVVGKYFLRSEKLLKQVSDNGFKLKLLVNNGCSFNCNGCQNGSKQCRETFKQNIQKESLNYLYAIQSFYPFELLNLLDSTELPIESIKISNRTDGYDYLDKCLDSYINLTDPQTFIDDASSNFRLWSRLAHFNQYMNELDNQEIIKIKQKEFGKKMYEILKLQTAPLIEENCFYKGDTSEIYKQDDILYKVYLKKEPFKRQILDYLIEHYDELIPYAIPPICKLKIGDTYGMKMRYVEGVDFLTYLESDDVNPYDVVRIIKTLSDNLKEINKLDIHFSDLHHHNVLLRRKDMYPMYIDLDDASVKEYGSTHICVMAHRLHNLEKKTYEYEDDLIKYGNLDQECLTLMLLNYMLDKSTEKLTYDEFNRHMEILAPYFNNDFMTALSSIKRPDDEQILNPYNYYIGDYIKDDNFPDIIQKVKRRQIHENSSI